MLFCVSINIWEENVSPLMYTNIQTKARYVNDLLEFLSFNSIVNLFRPCFLGVKVCLDFTALTGAPSATLHYGHLNAAIIIVFWSTFFYEICFVNINFIYFNCLLFFYSHFKLLGVSDRLQLLKSTKSSI